MFDTIWLEMSKSSKWRQFEKGKGRPQTISTVWYCQIDSLEFRTCFLRILHILKFTKYFSKQTFIQSNAFFLELYFYFDDFIPCRELKNSSIEFHLPDSNYSPFTIYSGHTKYLLNNTLLLNAVHCVPLAYI